MSKSRRERVQDHKVTNLTVVSKKQTLRMVILLLDANDTESLKCSIASMW